MGQQAKNQNIFFLLKKPGKNNLVTQLMGDETFFWDIMQVGYLVFVGMLDTFFE